MNSKFMATLRLVVCWLALQQAPAVAATVVGTVVGITDGDTLTLLDSDRHQHHVRLLGIDAPEKRQAFGEKAREGLATLAFQRTAVVDFKKRDRNGRILGRVLVDGRDVGLKQVEVGLAWHYMQFAREQSLPDRKAYAAAELQARAAGLGLWWDAHPQPPWEFRKSRTAHSSLP